MSARTGTANGNPQQHNGNNNNNNNKCYEANHKAATAIIEMKTMVTSQSGGNLVTTTQHGARQQRHGHIRLSKSIAAADRRVRSNEFDNPRRLTPQITIWDNERDDAMTSGGVTQSSDERGRDDDGGVELELEEEEDEVEEEDGDDEDEGDEEDDDDDDDETDDDRGYGGARGRAPPPPAAVAHRMAHGQMGAPTFSSVTAGQGSLPKVPSTDASSSKRSERSDELSMRSAMRKAGGRKQEKMPVSVGIVTVVAFILGGAGMFSYWEDWSIFDGAYYSFITLSTIGFGDIVPGKSLRGKGSENKLIICSLYLLVGMALIAMCFKLMQDDVVQKARWLGQKIGILVKDESSESESSYEEEDDYEEEEVMEEDEHYDDGDSAADTNTDRKTMSSSSSQQQIKGKERDLEAQHSKRFYSRR